jgi:hypothetical protein
MLLMVDSGMPEQIAAKRLRYLREPLAPEMHHIPMAFDRKTLHIKWLGNGRGSFRGFANEIDVILVFRHALT